MAEVEVEVMVMVDGALFKMGNVMIAIGCERRKKKDLSFRKQHLRCQHCRASPSLRYSLDLA
jgi:hypothetical protein